MKIKFLNPDRKNNLKDALIGKTGVIRFTKDFVKSQNLVKNEYWLLGIDEDEKSVKSIYLLKTKEKKGAFKMQVINGGWVIDSRSIFDKNIVKTPAKCKIEVVKVNNMEGFLLKVLD